MASAVFTSARDSDNIKGYFNNVKNVMYEEMAPNMTIYSPILLNTTWNALWRMALLIVTGFLGSLLNGYFISAFINNYALRKRGNVYLTCTALADLLVSSGVIPILAAVLITNGQWDCIEVCRGTQITVLTATYSYSMFSMLVAFDIYLRFCTAKKVYKKFVSMPIAKIACTIFIISFVVSFIGVYFELDYDYCKREHFGNVRFRVCTSIIFHLIPFTIIISLFYSSLNSIRSRIKRNRRQRRSFHLVQAFQYVKLISFAYGLFVLAWMPYYIIVHVYPGASDAYYYNYAWLGVSRSIFTTLIFFLGNGIFRRSFSGISLYCWCKSSIALPIPPRFRRRMRYQLETGDVKVFIDHKLNKSQQPDDLLARPVPETHSLEL